MNRSAAEKYANAMRCERPVHDVWDEFSYRHPKMKPGQRAKIFAPFDALRGFDLRLESILECCRAEDERGGFKEDDDIWYENRGEEAD